jgi:hypothetical protein
MGGSADMCHFRKSITTSCDDITRMDEFVSLSVPFFPPLTDCFLFPAHFGRIPSRPLLFIHLYIIATE